MKKAIALIIIILSLITFSFLGLLFTVDYRKVEQEFINLLGSDATSPVTVDKIEILKFPLPKLVAHNIKIPGILNAQEMIVEFSPISIFKHKPHITTITARQPGLDLKVLVQYEGEKLSYGKATIRAGHIAEFLKDYPDLQSVMTSLIPSHAIELTFDLVASDEYLNFANFDIESKALRCSGNIALSRNKISPGKMRLTCDKIQLVDEALDKVLIVAQADQQGLHLASASGGIVSGGSFSISGDLTKNTYRSLFEGKLQFSHNDINVTLCKLGMGDLAVDKPAKTALEADFKITPVEFLLHGLKGQVGSLNLAGNSDAKFIGSTPRIFLQFNITGFDSNEKYPVISSSLGYLASLMQGTQETSYNAKFVPIRNIDYLGSYEINLMSPVIFGRVIDNLAIAGNLSAGKLEIKSFDYSDGLSHITGSASIDTMSIKPIFDLTVKDGDLTSESFTLDNLLTLNTSLQNGDMSKMHLKSDISLNSLTQGDMKFSNVKLNFDNENNVINIPNFSANIGNGDVQINGTITVASPMKLGLAYVYNGVDLSKITTLFGSGVNLNGIANFAGIISTAGNSTKELLYNFYTRSKFIATKVEAQGIEMDDMVSKLSSLSYDQNNLTNDLKLATSSGSTQLHNINGSIAMDMGLITLQDVIFTSNYTAAALELAYNIYSQDMNLSSLWSFKLPFSDTNSDSTSIGIALKKKGGEGENHIDTAALLKSLAARANRNMIYPAPAPPALMPPPPAHN